MVALCSCLVKSMSSRRAKLEMNAFERISTRGALDEDASGKEFLTRRPVDAHGGSLDESAGVERSTTTVGGRWRASRTHSTRLR
jgi:hypothetical protein